MGTKSALNRSILYQGWREYRRQLDGKLQWRVGRFILVTPHQTSRTFPDCSPVAKENQPTQARFACETSGAVMPPIEGTRRSDWLGRPA